MKNLKINAIKNPKKNHSSIYLFLILSLCASAISSCATTGSSNAKSMAELESYNLDINKTNPNLIKLYYRDIFSSDKSLRSSHRIFHITAGRAAVDTFNSAVIRGQRLVAQYTAVNITILTL